MPGEGLVRAIPRRLREFSAGRAAARMAMARPLQPLPMRPDRAPHWPDDLCGSISHSDTACLAIAAPLAGYRGLGIDLEPALPLDRALWDTVLTKAERNRVSRLSGAEAGDMAKLIFSAKEAVYKAQYRISERLFGFEDMQVVITEQTFISEFGTTSLEGRWCLAAGHILTLVAIPA